MKHRKSAANFVNIFIFCCRQWEKTEFFIINRRDFGGIIVFANRKKYFTAKKVPGTLWKIIGMNYAVTAGIGDHIDSEMFHDPRRSEIESGKSVEFAFFQAADTVVKS